MPKNCIFGHFGPVGGLVVVAQPINFILQVEITQLYMLDMTEDVSFPSQAFDRLLNVNASIFQCLGNRELSIKL